MHTTTIKQILGPIAESISQFIVLNEDVELYDIELPDISPVAEAVAQQAVGLVNVGKQMAASPDADDDLREDMPVACDLLLNAARMLTESARYLTVNTRDSVNRKKMVEGAKGILTGTSRILEVSDDSEVRKIQRAIKEAKVHISILLTVETVEHLLQTIKPACQALITLAQLANKRVEELLHFRLRQRLKDASDIVRNASTLLVSSSKTVVQSRNNEAAKESRQYCCTQLRDACDEIAWVIVMKEAPTDDPLEAIGPIARARAELNKQLLDISTAVMNRDPVALQQATDALFRSTDVLLDNARAIANRTKDPKLKQAILDSIKRIEDLRERIADVSKRALANPNDAALQRELHELLAAANAEFANLENLCTQALADEINKSVATLGDHTKQGTAIARLVQAAKNGDKNGILQAIRDFENETERLRQAARIVADSCEDPEVARRIRVAEKSLGAALPQVVTAGKALANDPHSTAASEHLKNTVNLWENAVRELNDAVKAAYKPEALVSQYVKGARQDLEEMARAIVLQNPELMRQATDSLLSKVAAIGDIARKEIENSDDPEYKRLLAQKLKEMEDAARILEEKARHAYNNPHDAKAQADFKRAGEDLIAKMQAVEDTIRNQRNGTATLDGKLKAMDLGEDVVVVEGNAPRLLTAEEAAANPIKAAAQELKVEAAQWDAQGNRMIQMANVLAEKMARLAELQKLNTPGSKKELIELAKEIMQDVKIIVEEAQIIANNCTDKRLKQHLLLMIERIPTISQQLKIVAAVKASNPDDHDNDLQMISCAQNLMSAVKDTIRSSEAASIRSVNRTGNTQAASKFRRKVYKGDGSSQQTQLQAKLTSTLNKSRK